MAPAAAAAAAAWLKTASDEALVDCVKHTQKAGLKGTDGKEWKAYVQGLPAAQRHQDPSRHAREQLLGFLSGVTSDEAQAKALKRYGKWRTAVQEEAAAARAAAAAGAPPPAAGGGGGAGGGTAAGGSGVWQLVERTRAHPKFARAYNFPSWEKGWIRTSRLTPAAPEGAPPRLLALDCEMCETSESANALLSLAVVDEAGGVVFKELVQPEGEIIDLRTPITGITPAHLEGITLRRKAAAARLAALLGPGVVLVGHSLSADLAALKLDHQPVIDTALLFSYKGLSHATPSLVHLAEQLLGQKLRVGDAAAGDAGVGDAAGGGAEKGSSKDEEASKKESRKRKKAAAAGGGSGGGGEGVHDSREDAAAAMALVLHEVAAAAEGQPTPPLEPPAVKVPKSELCKLLVHSIPAAVAAPQLAVTHAFGRAGAPPPAAVGPGAAAGQMLLGFADPAAAEAAFAALPGARGADSLGRHQKELELAGGAKVRVRKMGAHAGAVFGRDAKRDRGEPAGGGKKRRDRKGRPQGAASPGAGSGTGAGAGSGAGGGGKRKRDGGGGKGGGGAGAAPAEGAQAGGGGEAGGGGAAGGSGGDTRAEKRRRRAQQYKEGLAGGQGGPQVKAQQQARPNQPQKKRPPQQPPAQQQTPAQPQQPVQQPAQPQQQQQPQQEGGKKSKKKKG
ncbi:MAG: hypothetical protein J3K34DRAFT_522384 [Monoraphidium minutum]|nr:MAG: hypothetical protein J3K34DRAFT_522384 [Monoraphidium minutum]